VGNIFFPVMELTTIDLLQRKMMGGLRASSSLPRVSSSTHQLGGVEGSWWGGGRTEWVERRVAPRAEARVEEMAVVARRCEIRDEPILLILLMLSHAESERLE
jgi:hypothetical protein